MRLILTRHGETLENVEGIMQGHLPGTLSEKGQAQGLQLAERLREEHIDCIYTSDLARASDTAELVAKYHPDIPFYTTKELRERDIGELTGKKKSALGWPKSRSLVNAVISDGESLQDMYRRAQNFLAEIKEKHADDTVLCVAHNGINKAIVAVLTGKNASEIPDVPTMDNTSINIFSIAEECSTELFNCTEHLT